MWVDLIYRSTLENPSFSIGEHLLLHIKMRLLLGINDVK